MPKPKAKLGDASKVVDVEEIRVEMPEHVEIFYREYEGDFGFRHWKPTGFEGQSTGHANSTEAAEFAALQLPGVPIEFNCPVR